MNYFESIHNAEGENIEMMIEESEPTVPYVEANLTEKYFDSTLKEFKNEINRQQEIYDSLFIKYNDSTPTDLK